MKVRAIKKDPTRTVIGVGRLVKKVKPPTLKKYPRNPNKKKYA